VVPQGKPNSLERDAAGVGREADVARILSGGRALAVNGPYVW